MFKKRANGNNTVKLRKKEEEVDNESDNEGVDRRESSGLMDKLAEQNLRRRQAGVSADISQRSQKPSSSGSSSSKTALGGGSGSIIGVGVGGGLVKGGSLVGNQQQSEQYEALMEKYIESQIAASTMAGGGEGGSLAQQEGVATTEDAKKRLMKKLLEDAQAVGAGGAAGGLGGGKSATKSSSATAVAPDAKAVAGKGAGATAEEQRYVGLNVCLAEVALPSADKAENYNATNVATERMREYGRTMREKEAKVRQGIADSSINVSSSAYAPVEGVSKVHSSFGLQEEELAPAAVSRFGTTSAVSNYAKLHGTAPQGAAHYGAGSAHSDYSGRNGDDNTASSAPVSTVPTVPLPPPVAEELNHNIYTGPSGARGDASSDRDGKPGAFNNKKRSSDDIALARFKDREKNFRRR